MYQRLFPAVAAVCALVGLSACSASETDFKDAAEQAIEDAAEAESIEVTELSCDEPAATDVGTEFDCSFTIDGTNYTAPASITSDDEVTVDLQQMAPTEG